MERRPSTRTIESGRLRAAGRSRLGSSRQEWPLPGRGRARSYRCLILRVLRVGNGRRLAGVGDKDHVDIGHRWPRASGAAAVSAASGEGRLGMWPSPARSSRAAAMSSPSRPFGHMAVAGCRIRADRQAVGCSLGAVASCDSGDQPLPAIQAAIPARAQRQALLVLTPGFARSIPARAQPQALHRSIRRRLWLDPRASAAPGDAAALLSRVKDLRAAVTAVAGPPRRPRQAGAAAKSHRPRPPARPSPTTPGEGSRNMRTASVQTVTEASRNAPTLRATRPVRTAASA